MKTTMTYTNITIKNSLHICNDILNLSIDPKYFNKGVLLALDSDMIEITSMNTYLQSSPIIILLSHILISLSIIIPILFMDEGNVVQEANATQEINVLTEENNNNERPSKPVMDIVFKKIDLDNQKYFIYNRNERPGDESIASIILVHARRLRVREMNIDGRIYQGVLRTRMDRAVDDGRYLPLKPTKYRSLVETHNLMSNGRNIILRNGSVIIYEDNIRI